MNSKRSSEYHAELQGRLQGLLITVEQWLAAEHATLISELIDANETGLALEMISDLLLAAEAPIDRLILDDVVRLASAMGLPMHVGEQLASCVE